jgi:hypothetical protein
VYTHPSNHAISVITGLQAALDGKTTESYVNTAVSNLVDSSPATLNTLNELAAALGDDANFSTTVTNSIATKAPIASPSFTGNVGIGTASPANPLHVTKEIAGYQAYFNNDNGSAQGLKVRVKANDSGNFNILDLVSASTGSDVSVMTVRDDGNVGIGTSSPATPLQVNASSGATYPTLGTASGSLGLSVNDLHGMYLGVDGSSGNGWLQAMREDGDGTPYNMVLQPSGGRVGIGTSSPQALLDLKGSTDSYAGMAKIYLTDVNSNSASRNWSIGNGGSAYGNFTIGVSNAKNGDPQASGTHINPLVITSEGIVTMPYQPAFCAYANTQNNMGINAWLQIAFANQQFDQNQDYAANTFVAPVTGKYQLQISVRLDNLDTNTQYYQVRIRTSNRSYHSICDFDGMSTDPSYWNFNNAVLADMDANDTCVIEFLQAGGNNQTDINDESYFNGFLAC